MSVAAMTMDDQRPLMNSYEKMSSTSTKYDQNLHIISGSSGGVIGGGNGVGVGMSSVNTAPPSGPASPTPSGSEEQLAAAGAATVVAATAGAISTSSASSHHHHSHPHHNHHHHHHHHHHQQQQQQLQQQSQSKTTQHQEQQQREQQSSHATATAIAEAVAVVEQRNRLLEDEIDKLKLEKIRVSQQCSEALRREKILMRRLANKEQEFQEYVRQIGEHKAQQAPTSIALRTALLDPAVNLLFERIKRELKNTKAKLDETQNELSAWKFTPDSNTGKRLMAKCRLLYQENEELGKMTSNGRLAKLEAELGMQKSFSDEVKKSQSELDDFLQELDEDVEGMQSTILFLQQELKTTRDRLQIVEKENYHFKNGSIESEAEGSLSSQLPEENNDDGNMMGGIGNLNGIDEKCGLTFQAQQSVVVLNNNNEQFNKYQQTPMKLETISELECLQAPVPLIVAAQPSTMPPTPSTIIHTTSNNSNNAVDYYNGSVVNEQQQQQQLPQPQETSLNLVISDENSNGSKSGRLSRKRIYDEDISYITPNTAAGQMIVDSNEFTPAREISTPRTLPPKKSKLRGITARRNSQLDENLVGGGGSSPLIQPSTPHIGMVVVDNAVAGMASEEFSGNASILATPNDVNMVAVSASSSIEPESSTTPARVLTRRRSVRQLQQNGGGGIGGEY